jgi:hypothetical protein
LDLSFIILILSTVTTFGLFTILLGEDNPWFAFAENTYVGVAIGLSVVLNTSQFLINNVLSKTTANLTDNWPLVISMVLGLLMLTRISSKYSYISRIPIAVVTGVGVAVTTRAIIFSSVIAQITATIKPLLNMSDPAVLFTNIMVLVFVLTMLSYFFYTVENKGALKTSSTIGRYILYASFGTLFAITYMGRLGLLLGRMETLLIPASSMYVTLTVVAIVAVTIYLLIKRYPTLMKKLTPE